MLEPRCMFDGILRVSHSNITFSHHSKVLSIFSPIKVSWYFSVSFAACRMIYSSLPKLKTDCEVLVK